MNLEPTLWPRAAALAEVFWSGPGPDGRPRSQFLQIVFSHLNSLINIADFFFFSNFAGANKALSRMHDIRYRMVGRGVRAAPLQPHWCALRPGRLNRKTITNPTLIFL